MNLFPYLTLLCKFKSSLKCLLKTLVENHLAKVFKGKKSIFIATNNAQLKNKPGVINGKFYEAKLYRLLS